MSIFQLAGKLVEMQLSATNRGRISSAGYQYIHHLRFLLNLNSPFLSFPAFVIQGFMKLK
jgi:hypothetical protein